MFGTQSLRLLRETWPNPTMLAQELYAIFQDTNPVSSGPITINNPPTSGLPGLSPENLDLGWTPLTFGSNPDAQTKFQMAPDGGMTIKTPSLDFVDNTGKPLKQKGNASSFPGQVKSGGPGKGPYTVDVYQDGLAGEVTSMQVTQLDIDPTETIPADTWVIVSVLGSENVMQVPVWQ